MSKPLKKIILGVLAVLAMFIPTYIAIANYAALGSWQSGLTDKATVITVQKGLNGPTVFSGSAGEDVNRDIAGALAELLSDGKALRTAPTMTAADVYSVTAKTTDKELPYTCHYNTEGAESYLFDVNANVCYEVKSEDMKAFLSRFFYGQSHNELSVPVLITAGNEVTPSYINWYHKNTQQLYTPVLDLATASEEETYPVNKHISLRFEPAPDAASVKVYRGPEEIYSGDYAGFSALSYEDSVNLTVMIQAKWDQKEDRDFYGEASYQFYVNYSANPAFALSAVRIATADGRELVKSATVQNYISIRSEAEDNLRLSATAGDYVGIHVLNSTDPQNITVKSTPDLGVTPVFYADGDYVRGLLPLKADLEGGDYRITVSTRGAEETFTLTVEERSPFTRPYDAGADLIRTARSAAALAEYDTLRKQIGQTRSTTNYLDGKFIDFGDASSIGAKLYLGYGHTRTLSTGDSYRMDGVDFYIYPGVEIPSLNSGMVIATGQNANLGNYVIVDHGLGLRTWYCHLSEISVSVGDAVKKAQAVGKSGETGFTITSGVYLICTIGETPISPYTLWDYGVVY